MGADRPKAEARERESSTLEIGALLDRLERQAESLGALSEQVRTLDELLENERLTTTTLGQQLEQQRKARAEEARRHLQLEERIQDIHDSSEDLARERRTVAALQSELQRAWTEIRELHTAMEGRRTKPFRRRRK